MSRGVLPIRVLAAFLAFSYLSFLGLISSCSAPGEGGLPADEAAGEEKKPRTEVEQAGDEAHAALYEGKRFPSALDCAKCHPRQFEEWSVSSHAYAEMSPVFNAMQAALMIETNGTNGEFCIRCHSPVGMQRGEPILARVADRHPTAREGITCIVCHRINQAYGKNSGRFALREGDIHSPVQGPTGPAVLQKLLADPENKGRLSTESKQGYRSIHANVEPFFALTKPGFCGVCHDVTFFNGLRLEEAFSHYKMSPAARNGTTCQDCHMRSEPGVPTPYERGPAAVVPGLDLPERNLSNHLIAGPDYSIIHPALYPLNPALAEKLDWHKLKADYEGKWKKWMSFDWRAKWGSPEFEENEKLVEQTKFPEAWADSFDREDAWELISRQIKLLERAAAARKKVLQAGYQFGKQEVLEAGEDGLRFRIQFRNGTDGHAVPTGFIAERTVFIRVTVTDADGTQVFISGDLDPNGDVRDSHSVYVHNGELPADEQLFTLQSRFITRNVRGSEREQVLAINHSATPLPFARPSRGPTILSGRPGGARIHRILIEPKGSRWATYTVEGDRLTGRSPYTVKFEIVTGMLPPNLIDRIKAAGFDYEMSPRRVAREIVEPHSTRGHQVLWERTLKIDVPGKE